MACSSCARETPRSVAWARVVSSCVCACATSTPETTPWLKRFIVICSAFSYAATVESSSCFCVSSPRSSK